MQWDSIIQICVCKLSVMIPCCINYVSLYNMILDTNPAGPDARSTLLLSRRPKTIRGPTITGREESQLNV